MRSFIVVAVLASATADPANARCRRSTTEPMVFTSTSGQTHRQAYASTNGVKKTLFSETAHARTGDDAKHYVAASLAEKPLPTPVKKAPITLPPTFLVSAGETLHHVLYRWATGAGWSLVWEPANDYTLSAGASFHGDLKESLRSLMESLRAGGAPYGVELWAANRIVRVVVAR